MQPPVIICIYTLGCKVNQCDSEELARALARQGYQVQLGLEAAASAADPSLCIINTCTVTTTADAKARKLVRKLAREHPRARIIVTGCYAERDGPSVSGLTERIHVLPNRRKADIPEIVAEVLPAPGPPEPAFAHSGRVRAFVKVQDGCSHACAYCIVHSVRGPMVSLPAKEALAHIKQYLAAGVKEIVLCGIRLGAYGRDLPRRSSLAALLNSLRDLPVARLRLSSIEPLDVTDELVAEFADHPGLCHHLHLPLQSGDDALLAAMNRGYGLGDFRDLVNKVRNVWGDLALTTDIMVGFPGETEEAFSHTLAALSEFEFSRAHLFRYSPRPGTPAAAMQGPVSETVKRERLERAQAVANEIFARRAGRLQGQVVEVLAEGPAAGSTAGHPPGSPTEGCLEGLTRHYDRVVFPAPKGSVGELVSVKIAAAGTDFLIGESASDNP